MIRSLAPAGPGGELRWPGALLLAALVALAAWLESCAAVRAIKPDAPSKDSILKFSHAKHAEYVKDCNACHLSKPEGEWEEAKIENPGHAACVSCHAAASDAVPASKDCLLCHHTTTPAPARRAPRPDYSRASFDHEPHSGVSCAECHGQVDKGGMKAVLTGTAAKFPAMEECVACHFPGIGQTSSAECAVCHAEITAATIPKNHRDPAWDKIHGQASNANPDSCVRCHEPPRDCAQCHAMEMPSSHNLVFRERTHGFHALDNAQSCQTCHQQDFCEDCHRTTEPKNHTASFKDKPFLHCATCHLPLDEGNRCSVCHQGDPHEDVHATPPPPELVEFGFIKPTEPCLPCHPLDSVPITQPYNTVSLLECVVCHRF